MTDIGLLRQLEQKVVQAERPYNRSIKPENAIYYDLEQLIASESACVLVAQDGDLVIATGYVQTRVSKASLIHEEHGYLGFMYVDELYRGMGINRLLTDKLIVWGKERGLSDFYLDVYADNQPALKAYEKSGFKTSMIEMKLTLD